MKKIYLLLIIIAFIEGCKDKEDSNSKLSTSNKAEINSAQTLPQNTFKGMYNKSDNTANLYECDTEKKYIVSSEGENVILETIYKTFQHGNPGKKIYVFVEGFSSVRQKSDAKEFDTILVITRLIGTDTTVNCAK